jgi:hypothetical protein
VIDRPEEDAGLDVSGESQENVFDLVGVMRASGGEEQ